MEGIRKDGVLVSARKILNFIQGSGMTVTITDSGSAQNVIDILLSSSGGAPSGAAGGDLSGTYPNPDVVNDSHSHAVSTAPGTTDHSALSNVFADQHHTESHNMVQHSIAGSVDIGNVGATNDGGVSNKVPRADHVHAHGALGGSVASAHAHADLSGTTATDHHPAPAAGPDADSAIDGTGATGTAATFARSGHGHKVATTDAPSGAVISIDAAASAAATGAIARAAHGHRMNTSASAAAAIGTAAAGTSGHSPSRDDHVHATGAGTPSTQAMGDAAATGTGPAASMTDHKHAMPAATVTNTLFIPQQMMTADAGVSTAHGTAPDVIQSWLLADAATQGAYFHFVVPNDWSSGAITYTIYWAPGSTDATPHTVRWSTDVLLMTTGTTSTVAAGTTTAFTGTSAARTSPNIYTEPAQTLTTPASVGQLVRVDIRRLGADAADTYVGAVRLHGVLLSYTATR